LGAELGWRRITATAGLGAGVAYAQARLTQKGQSPAALLSPFWTPWSAGVGETARLFALGPALTARLGVGLELGPGALVLDARMDAPIFIGTALTGFTGGPVVGVGYGLSL